MEKIGMIIPKINQILPEKNSGLNIETTVGIRTSIAMVHNKPIKTTNKYLGCKAVKATSSNLGS